MICGTCVTNSILLFQSELDTLTSTLKQLENQKGEAQKRLDDLKAQVSKRCILDFKIACVYFLFIILHKILFYNKKLYLRC